MEKDEIEQAKRVRLVRSFSRQHALRGVVVADSGKGTKAKLKKKNGKTQLAGWKHFLAGATAGCCEVLGTMPLDVVKTQMQINPNRYTGPLNAMSVIYKLDGFKGLYYGMPAFLVQTSGKAAIRFAAFAKIKHLLEKVAGEENVEKNKVISNLACGLLAGAVEASVWTTPTERVKVLRQADIGATGTDTGLIKNMVKILKTGGVASLFVGLVPTVLRQASSVGIRFMLYDSVKSGISYLSGGKDGGTLTYMAAGGTVGAFSVALNNPLDVVKNIAQSGKSKGSWHIAKEVWQQNGFLGFTRGLSARVPRVFCGQAITFAVYEKVAGYLVETEN